MPLEHSHEICIAQHSPTVEMGKNCCLITGNAAGQEQAAQVMARLLAADTGDSFTYQLTNGRLVSAPHLARFVYRFNQSAAPWISSSTAACKTARQ
jgi:ABC-type enterochelin transport system ATPase subunit